MLSRRGHSRIPPARSMEVNKPCTCGTNYFACFCFDQDKTFSFRFAEMRPWNNWLIRFWSVFWSGFPLSSGFFNFYSGLLWKTFLVLYPRSFQRNVFFCYCFFREKLYILTRLLYNKFIPTFITNRNVFFFFHLFDSLCYYQV